MKVAICLQLVPRIRMCVKLPSIPPICHKYFCFVTDEPLSDVAFSGTRSYLSLPPMELHPQQTSIDMEVRPLYDRGLLLFVGQPDGGSFLSLSLQGGVLELRLGSGIQLYNDTTAQLDKHSNYNCIIQEWANNCTAVLSEACSISTVHYNVNNSSLFHLSIHDASVISWRKFKNCDMVKSGLLQLPSRISGHFLPICTIF